MFATRFLIFAATAALMTGNARAFVREFDDSNCDPNTPSAQCPPPIPIAWTKNRTVLVHLSLPPNNQGPFQDGSPNLNASAEDAMNIWNQNLVHMKFAVDRDSILPPSGTDGNTSISMSNTVYGEAFGNGVLAVTLVTPRNGVMVEADIVLNNVYTYDSYRGPLQQGDLQDFHRIVLHELGHVIGLDHPDQANPPQHVTAIMNSIISNTDGLTFDDMAGAHFIYNGGPDYQNSVPAPNLVNLSTRAFVGTGDNNVIGGFIIQGSQPATVVLRGIGNSLPALGITNALADPVIELHSASGTTLATNDDWIDDPNSTTIASYHLDPTNSQESALVETLNPGSYTLVIHSFDNGDGKLTGTALVELYDLHTNSSIPSSPGRAGNISTRAQVLGNGSQLLIGGFIVGGMQSKTVVVRAIGPSLSAVGISQPLSDPLVELHDSSGTTISSNDNWQSGPNAAQIQSENLAPSQPNESALQATLNPGSYTAIVRSANGSDGVALVEVYDLSPAPN